MAKCPPKAPVCSDTTCPIEFQSKGCQCMTVKGDSCNPIKTMCAYEDGGVLYGCPVGCCNNQCDGQCGAPAYGGDSTPTQYTPLDIQMQKYVLAIVILLIGLLLMSSVSV